MKDLPLGGSTTCRRESLEPSTGIVGSCGVFLLVKFLCAILLRMGCGRSLSVLRILPTGMCFLSAW